MNGQLIHFLAQAALLLPAFLLVLSVHEASHAWMAHLLGDDTPKRQGRLSLNPLVHIDPLGLLALLVFRIGWAKPVMFDHRNFKRPKLYSVLTALAGPASNFVLALVVLVVWRLLPVEMFSVGVATTLVQLFEVTAYVSVMLGVFNLLPIPPLDGSHILMVMLMDRHPKILFWLYRYSIFVLILLFVVFEQPRVLLLSLIMAVYTFLHGLVF